MTALSIDNRTARHLWLDAQGLSNSPVGAASPIEIIRKLGMVQLDTIKVVERAQDHILWSRNQTYRPKHLHNLLAKDRAVFEHFTHDASVLPVEYYAMWRRQMRRITAKIDKASWNKTMPGPEGRAAIKARIAQEGPLSTHAFDTKVQGKKEMWARPPHKLALDYMWYGGELATCHRDGFTKVYDLTERVVPEAHRAADHSDAEMLDWMCRTALDKQAFGSLGDIQRFWSASDAGEVKAWAKTADMVPVEIKGADGSLYSVYAVPDIEDRIAQLEPPTKRLRILNPFDPVARDRDRLERLFGFNYRIEMFVPAAKRVWGYYVFPILEGDRFIGRIEAKADRKAGTLDVLNLWAEPKIKWTKARRAKLEGELDRFARFAGLTSMEWRTQYD
jgi:uncharacterized protein YcaQ